MRKYAFSRRSRLRLKNDFQAVFDVGRKVQTRNLIAWYVLSTGSNKYGLMVSKKTGGAVRRNAIKRLLREAIRLRQENFQEGIRIIIYPKAKCGIYCLEDAVDSVEELMSKADLLKKSEDVS